MRQKAVQYYSRTLKLLKDIFFRSLEDDIMGVGAQMSYYVILAFFPFLIFVIALLSYTRISEEEVLKNLIAYLPPDVYAVVVNVVLETVRSTSSTILSFGALATLWVASNGAEVLMLGINKAYDLTETRPYWKIKLLSIGFTLGLALVYMFSLIMVVFGGLIAKKIFNFFHISDFLVHLWDVGRYMVPFTTILSIFMIMYHYMPVKRIGFKKILPGAIFSTLGWILISHIFSVYINHFGSYTKTYGSLGSIIVLLLWLYWCGIMIMLGAELIASLYYYRAQKKR